MTYVLKNWPKTDKKVMLSVGKPRDAAVNFDRYRVCRQLFRMILVVAVDMAKR